MYYLPAADLEFKEKQLAVTKDNVEKTYRLGLAKAEPEVIQLLKMQGEIKLKDPSKEEIPFGEQGYVEQYDITDKANKNITSYLNDLVVAKLKDYKQVVNLIKHKRILQQQAL